MFRFPHARMLLTCLLVGYWVGMFVGTHVPKIPRALETSIPDKTLHYGAFAGLGFLLAARRACTSRLRRRDLLILLAVVAAYGAFDEVTQIPVGRTADVFDWVADVVGAASGLICFVAIGFVTRQRGLSSGLQSLNAKEPVLASAKAKPSE